MTITIILLTAIYIVAITLIVQYYLERDESSDKNKSNIREVKNKLYRNEFLLENILKSVSNLYKSIKDYEKRRSNRIN